MLDEGAKPGVDRAFAATHRDRLPVAKQEVAHRCVARQVVSDVRRQHRAQVQPWWHLAVGIEMQDHLGAFAWRPAGRGGHVEGVEPRSGNAQQPIGPRNVSWIARMASVFMVWVAQPEFAVAPNLERLLHQGPLVRRQPYGAPPHPVIAVSEAHRPTAPPFRLVRLVIVARGVRGVGLRARHAGQHAPQLGHRQRRRQVCHLCVVFGVRVANDQRSLVLAQLTSLEQPARRRKGLECPRHPHEAPRPARRHAAAPHHPMLRRADAEALPGAGSDDSTDHTDQFGRHHVQQTYEVSHAVLGRPIIAHSVFRGFGQRHVSTLHEHVYGVSA
jgi:hypothetical protein